MHPQREGGDFFDLYPIKCSFKHNLFCSKDVSPLGKSHQEEISVHVIRRLRDREKYSLISLQHCDSLRRIFLSAEKKHEEGSYFWEQDCYYLGTSWSCLLTFVWFCATHLCCKLNLIWSTEMSLFSLNLSVNVGFEQFFVMSYFFFLSGVFHWILRHTF